MGFILLVWTLRELRRDLCSTQRSRRRGQLVTRSQLVSGVVSPENFNQWLAQFPNNSSATWQQLTAMSAIHDVVSQFKPKITTMNNQQTIFLDIQRMARQESAEVIVGESFRILWIPTEASDRWQTFLDFASSGNFLNLLQPTVKIKVGWWTEQKQYFSTLYIFSGPSEHMARYSSVFLRGRSECN